MINRDLINSVYAWNRARYPQVVSRELQTSLLLEELKETLAAYKAYQADRTLANLVEVLDGCGDVIFVAIGGMYKHKLTAEQAYFGLTTPRLSSSALSEPLGEDILEDIIEDMEEQIAGYEVDKYTLFDNFIWVGYITSIMPVNAVNEVVAAICASNNTKEVKKTDPNIKANINKGKEFVPPTEALASLVHTRLKIFDELKVLTLEDVENAN